jgi:hypothetical protein
VDDIWPTWHDRATDAAGGRSDVVLAGGQQL